MSHSLDDVSEPKSRRDGSKSPNSDMSMMRIAIAGTGGLARLIAHFINEETAHHVVFLSRTEQPQLAQGGYQVAVVDYRDIGSLKYALQGTDTVISTVTGQSQIELIRAAVSIRVRRFIPAEFEGLPQLRTANDPLDRGRSLARQYLQHHAQSIQSTTIVCGIFYERFQPGGLQHTRIGLTSGLSGEGDYIMNCRNMDARVPAYDGENNMTVTICMTAAQDVARFVTKALDLPHWPAELRMLGQRVLVKDLVELVQRLKGQRFNPIMLDNPESLRHELRLATAQQDQARIIKLHTLLATAEGRYDFSQPNMNLAFPDVRCMPFQDWFIAKWNLQQ